MKDKIPLDPEKIMNREMQKKKDVALIPITVALAEFASIYKETFKLPLIWENPVTNWHFHLWVAPQVGREWLTQEQIDKRAKASAANKKRVATVRSNNAKKKASLHV